MAKSIRFYSSRSRGLKPRSSINRVRDENAAVTLPLLQSFIAQRGVTQCDTVALACLNMALAEGYANYLRQFFS